MRPGVTNAEVLLVACLACKGGPQLTPMLWFLPHCNQTWHQLLSGEIVSFLVENSQGPQLQVEERVSIFRLDRSWGSQETKVGGGRDHHTGPLLSARNTGHTPCHLLLAHKPSSSLLSEQLTDFPWRWLRFPPISICSLQLWTDPVLWALALG